ncbi:MAG TPA: CocE/NonD family hydrolase [Candidatus Dormibacteraeota bacterium]|nr:CocE/NonD family hydrolase [Candidatus Dormibacteraeota bacterium]
MSAAGRWRLVFIVALLAVGASTPVLAQPHQASQMPLLASCQPRTDTTDSFSYRFCSAPVSSFDGTALDVDLTLPSAAAARGGYPLLVLMHGWGADKTDFEAKDYCGTTVAYACFFNNVWFAHRGYAVVTYTARGFHASQGYTHLADMRWEVHDTQYLAGLLVDAGIARPGIGVAGLSYGGGQSWLLAVLADRVMNPDGSLTRWRSPAGKPMHVAAAEPRYTWTDLVDALTPNGRSSDNLLIPNGDRTSPYGIEKK